MAQEVLNGDWWPLIEDQKQLVGDYALFGKCYLTKSK